jgi:hypothetical protein
MWMPNMRGQDRDEEFGGQGEQGGGAAVPGWMPKAIKRWPSRSALMCCLGRRPGNSEWLRPAWPMTV